MESQLLEDLKDKYRHVASRLILILFEKQHEKNKINERKLVVMDIQIKELKKKADNDSDTIKELEDSCKKEKKDLEASQRQIQELLAANDRLDKNMKLIQSKLEDANIKLETQIAKVTK